LDSSNERSYQAPFCQILSHRGYTILHSTRHHPIEFGRDIVALDADGTPCAFQLKGNPSGRLSLRQFRTVEIQLFELASHPLIFPGITTERRHRAALVTNGEVDEDVHLALRNLNQRLRRQRLPQIELITRGRLLAWAKDLGVDLWPSELEHVSILLELLVENGRHLLPIGKFHNLVATSLGLNAPKRIPRPILQRRIHSAGVLVGIALKNFSASDNHWAIISGWVLYASYVIAACERFDVSYKNNGAGAVNIALEAILMQLAQLCSEATERTSLIEPMALLDAPFYRWRVTLIVALLCVYWLWAEQVGWPVQNHKQLIERFVESRRGELDLWGEGAVPQRLAHFWYERRRDATLQPEILLASIVSRVVQSAGSMPPSEWPNPYFTFSDLFRHQLSTRLASVVASADDPLREETAKGGSFFAASLLHMLVRTNLKTICQRLWPDISRLDFREFVPEYPWQYCLWRSGGGQELSVQPPLTKEWRALVEEARDVSGQGIPSSLRKEKYLLLLFVLLFPFRGTPSAIRFLDRKFNEQWMIPEPIGDSD
jgi:hypothetical protein